MPTDKKRLDFLFGKMTNKKFQWEAFMDVYYGRAYRSPRRALDTAMKAVLRGEGGE